MWRMWLRTHIVFSLELPHFDTIACRRCTELNGLLSRGRAESMSRSNASARGSARRREWIVSAVSTKDLLIFSRPLAMRTLAYSLAMFAALARSRPWIRANTSRKCTISYTRCNCVRLMVSWSFARFSRSCIAACRRAASVSWTTKVPVQLSTRTRQSSRTDAGTPASMSRAMAAIIAWRISSGLMVRSAPRLSNGRSPGTNEMQTGCGMAAGVLK